MIRKFLALSLAVLMLTACGTEKVSETSAPNTTKPTQKPEPQITKTAEVEVLGCRFADRVLPTDFEVFVGCYPAAEGEVYVDLPLRVTNTCEYNIDGKNVTGSFEYAGKRYAMQLAVEENAGDFANEEKYVPAGESRVVHLFYRVNGAAAETEITVNYTVLGEEKQITVSGAAEPALEDKHLLQIGDVFRREGAYSLEVVDCMISNSLRATGEGAVKYYVNGYQVLCLVLKLHNEGDEPLAFLEGYVLAGQQPEFATIQKESEDRKELEDMTDALEAGEEQILHLWVPVPLGTTVTDAAMRCNVLGDSFYCCPVG